MKTRVTVTLKPGVLDPQGKAIEGALKSLATIARKLRTPNLAAQLRATRDASAIYSMMTLTPTSHAA